MILWKYVPNAQFADVPWNIVEIKLESSRVTK